MPLATLRVAWTLAAPASVSLMLSPVTVRFAFSTICWGPGFAICGASFAALTVMATVSLSVPAPPKAPVLARSLTPLTASEVSSVAA